MRDRAIILLVTAVLATALLPGLGSAATLSGTITSDPAGTVLPGALIRTDSEPCYSAISDAGGNYSITLPANTCNVVVSCVGKTPQRATIITTGSTTKAFALRAAGSTGTRVSLPAPLDWGEPPGAPSTPPGDSYPVSFSDMATTTASDAPKISVWSEIVKPDESFTLSGCNFTSRSGADAGTDTIVWIWARTSDSGGVLRQARLWRVTDYTVTATVPDDVPYGVYLVWVENQNGVSAPICINKATAVWVGPLGNQVQAGNKKRVFGRNISQNRDSQTSFIDIQPTAGGSFISCPVNTVNPYMVEFTVPLGTPNGNYNVFVHNGHGGVYGWSDGLPLTVADDFVRGTGVYNVQAPTGSDDTTNIQTAINTANGWINGGTVQLQPGTYKINNQVTLKANVRLVGNGMDSTIIECRLKNQGSYGTYFYMTGNNMSVEGVELRACVPQPVNSYAGSFFYSSTITTPDSFKLMGCRISTEPAVSTWAGGAGGSRTEVANCEIYFGWSAGNYDGWIHDSNLYGGTYEGCEAPFSPTNRTVFEHCNIMTQNWPYDPSKPNPWNYEQNLPYSAVQYMPWAKRISLYAYYGYLSQDTYSAYLTGTNIAVEGGLNRGEEFLAHPMRGQWFGQVASNNGCTLTVNPSLFTDVVFTNDAYGHPVNGGGPVPNYQGPDYWLPVDGTGWVTIMSGRGAGQSNKVASHTTSTVTVLKPWRVQPDGTSIINVGPLYVDHVVYNTSVSAFPAGYVEGYSGSCTAQLANCMQFFMENCNSYRTYGGAGVLAHSGGPSNWCMVRGVQAHDCFNNGFGSFTDPNYTNSLAPVLLGNSFHNCSANVIGTIYYCGSANSAMSLLGEGIVSENFTTPSPGDTGKGVVMGYRLSGAAALSSYQNGFTLYRNGSITTVPDAIDPPVLEPVYVSSTDGRQFLINNHYMGASQNYYLASGLSSYSIPAPEYRVAKFCGYVGSTIRPQILPVANAGITSMAWTATPNDPWITASIQSNGTLSQESTLGRLVIGVDTTAMAAGTHWGSVTISTAASSVKVGVRVDLSSGAPSNQLPTASFTETPTAGAAPLAVAFDASGSFDVDGSIASYYWDFGDGTYGSGVTTTHAYAAAGTYTPVLTVTDDASGSGSSWTNVSVSPTLTAVTLAGNPVGAVAAGTPVTLTASAVGGYQVQYKFLLKTSTGWGTLRDYQSGATFTWTPSVSASYEVKVYARNLGSTNVYDVQSDALGYPVGLLPTGAKLWLKADAGISTAGTAVSGWADQSGTGNNVSQPVGSLQPVYVSNAMNGRPVVRFTGPGQLMQSLSQVLSGNTSFTTFTVLRFNQIPGTYQYFWWNGSDQPAGGYGSYLNTSGNTRCGWGSYSAAPTYATAATIGTCYRVCTRFTSTSGSGPNELWVNGTSAGSRPKSGSDLSGGTFTLGNYGPSTGSGLYGDIAEVLIYDRSLSDTERLNVDQYLSDRWMTSAPLAIDRLKDVKALGDGVSVTLTSPKVAIVASGVYSDGSVYVCEQDRTCGLKVLNVGTVNLWDNLNISGTTDTDVTTGERILRATSVNLGSNTPLGTLGMSNKTICASGQLVRVWGKVASKSAGSFVINDGSGSLVTVDVSGLAAPLAVLPDVGAYVGVTGPAGCAQGAALAIKPRSGNDIQVF